MDDAKRSQCRVILEGLASQSSIVGQPLGSVRARSPGEGYPQKRDILEVLTAIGSHFPEDGWYKKTYIKKYFSLTSA